MTYSVAVITGFALAEMIFIRVTIAARVRVERGPSADIQHWSVRP
jgi:hypothetical protein